MIRMRQEVEINWTLVSVLCTTDVLLRLINIFGLTVADRCIGHNVYWYQSSFSGVSIFGALFSILVLCLVWAILDLALAYTRFTELDWSSILYALFVVVLITYSLFGLLQVKALSEDVHRVYQSRYESPDEQDQFYLNRELVACYKNAL